MGTKKPRVLCVDDNHDIADTEAMLLELQGFDARPCYSGDQAISEARAFCPDAYLVDLDMPEKGGCEVARELRAEYEGPPPLLVAVTARGGVDDFRRTEAAGFDAHLVKPVDPALLVKALADVKASGKEPPCHEKEAG